MFGEILLVTGFFYFIDKSCYKFFEDGFSDLRDRFNQANANKEVIKTGGTEAIFLKEGVVERYDSILNENIPKYFKFTHPLFYSETKKELTLMKSESKKGLEEIAA